MFSKGVHHGILDQVECVVPLAIFAEDVKDAYIIGINVIVLSTVWNGWDPSISEISAGLSPTECDASGCDV